MNIRRKMEEDVKVKIRRKVEEDGVKVNIRRKVWRMV